MNLNRTQKNTASVENKEQDKLGRLFNKINTSIEKFQARISTWAQDVLENIRTLDTKTITGLAVSLSLVLFLISLNPTRIGSAREPSVISEDTIKQVITEAQQSNYGKKGTIVKTTQNIKGDETYMRDSVQIGGSSQTIEVINDIEILSIEKSGDYEISKIVYLDGDGIGTVAKTSNSTITVEFDD